MSLYLVAEIGINHNGELELAMQVFVNCVELASVQQRLKEIGG